MEIHTDEGVTGIGETDVNPWIAKACIEAPGSHNMGVGLTEMLTGADPFQVEALWERMYVGSAMNGRRGAVINAIGALDIALHDLRGKVLGKPCYELLGGAAQQSITPHASLQPETGSYEDYRDSMIEWAKKAVAAGFRAVKAEITLAGPYAHTGLREPWERSTEVLAGVRGAAGPDVAVLVDVQYAFPDAGGRVGGLTEARRVCDLAAQRGLQVVPHLWKTGISVAAAVHLAATASHCPYIEYMPANLTASGLRRDAADDGVRLTGGRVSLPTRPGLGVEVNRDAVRHYETAARNAYHGGLEAG